MDTTENPKPRSRTSKVAKPKRVASNAKPKAPETKVSESKKAKSDNTDDLMRLFKKLDGTLTKKDRIMLVGVARRGGAKALVELGYGHLAKPASKLL